MENLNIASSLASPDLFLEISKLGVIPTHYKLEIWGKGSDEDIAAVRVMLETYNFEAGLFATTVTKMNNAIQTHLDNEAKAAGYDNMISACSYAAFPNAFQLEAQSFLVWRAEVWTYVEAQQQEVILGNRTVPTIVAMEAELPTRVI